MSGISTNESTSIAGRLYSKGSCSYLTAKALGTQLPLISIKKYRQKFKQLSPDLRSSLKGASSCHIHIMVDVLTYWVSKIL